MADKYADIVMRMKNDSPYLEPMSVMGYKLGVAKRFQRKYGKKLSVVSNQKFVEELIKAGELEKEVLQ